MTADSTAPVLFEVDGSVARIVMNRPERSNAMNVPMLQAFRDAVQAAGANPTVRSVLLTGSGRNFCTGGDVIEFAEQREALPAYLQHANALLNEVVSALIDLPVPTIAVVQGYAAGGGGLGLVCSCDIVIAEPGAKFASGAARAGMAPDAGVSVTLTQLVGLRLATEILLAGRALSADEAVWSGLITRVDEDAATVAADFAARFAATPKQALAASKRLLWAGLGASVSERLGEEARTVIELSGTEDAREGLAAILEKRAPRFIEGSGGSR